MSQQPKIIWTTPADEIADKHPHAQLLFDTAGPPGAEAMGHNAMFLNVECETIADDPLIPDVDSVVKRLEEFMADDSLDWMEFESPHLPGRYFLSKAGARHVIAVQAAWSAKVRPRLVAGTDGVELRDHHTGLPVLRKKN